ncbi:hypothetical protein DM01DRAFT_1340955 [Hesseltinella vesiculosa]|uniref:F-box domain-containing protein n=1 Tax=Hesseltinella vesiculosa TaxID=101127 RepID=A0A1X2G2J6_9FUNG|nr:hypothetical protein DM01DRAFT_1340955 [Hesseltinella vesiculosa]
MEIYMPLAELLFLLCPAVTHVKLTKQLLDDRYNIPVPPHSLLHLFQSYANASNASVKTAATYNKILNRVLVPEQMPRHLTLASMMMLLRRFHNLIALDLSWDLVFDKALPAVLDRLPPSLVSLRLQTGEGVRAADLIRIHQTCPDLEILDISATLRHDLPDPDLDLTQNKVLKHLHLKGSYPGNNWRWFWFIGQKYGPQLQCLTIVGLGVWRPSDMLLNLDDQDQCFETFAKQHASTLRSLYLAATVTSHRFWDLMQTHAQPAPRLARLKFSHGTYLLTAKRGTTRENLQRILQGYRTSLKSLKLVLANPARYRGRFLGAGSATGLAVNPSDLAYIQEIIDAVEGTDTLSSLTIARSSRSTVQSSGIFPLDHVLEQLPHLCRLNVYRSTVITATRLPEYHHLSELCLDSCFVPEELLAHGFLHLPGLEALQIIDFEVFVCRQQVEDMDTVIPLVLPQGVRLTATMKYLDVVNERCLGRFKHISLSHSVNDPDPLAWEICSEERSVSRLPPEVAQQVAYGQRAQRVDEELVYDFHLKIVCSGTVSLQVIKSIIL